MSWHSVGKISLLRSGSWFVLLLWATSALAATDTWTGATDANWSTSGNWTTTNPGGVPANGDSLIFTGNTPNNSTSNNISGLTLNGITFDATAAAYTLGGPNAISLGNQTSGTGITSFGDVINNSSNSQTVNFGITLNAGKHVFQTSTTALSLGGLNTQLKGSGAIFAPGTGSINLAGSTLNNDSSTGGGILGGWAITGNDWAVRDSTTNNVVAYSAYTNISGGGVILDNPANNVRINAGTTTAITLDPAPTTANVIRINTLAFSAGTGTQPVTIGANNVLVLGQNGGILNTTPTGTARNLTIGATGVGTLTAGDGVNPANITLSGTPVGNATGIITVSSSITNNNVLGNNAPVSVTVMGQYVTLAATNTYSGGTYIVSGRVSQPTSNTLGSGPVYIFAGGQINPGANGAVNIANDISIAGNGTTEAGGGFGAIRMFQGTDNQSTLLTGTISLTETASVSANGQANLIRLTALTGRITGPGGLMIGSPTSNANASGSGIVVIGPLTGAGTASDYAGDTTIQGTLGGAVGSTLRIGNATASNILPHGNTGSFAGGKTGNMTLNANGATRPAVLDVNGSTQTINGLSNTSLSTANNFVQSSAASGLLILGDSDAAATFDGVVRNGAGNLSIRKIGSGTQSFGGANTYTGTTEVNAGTLLVNGTHLGAGIGAYAVAANATLGGTGTINAPVTVTGKLSPGTSPGTLSITNTLLLNPASALAMDLDGSNPSGTNDLVDKVTDLTLDGTLSVTANPSGSFATATAGNSWRLINYAGNLTNNGLDLGTMPALTAGLSFSIDTSITGQVNLLVSSVPEASAFLAVGLAAVGTIFVGLVRRRRTAT